MIHKPAQRRRARRIQDITEAALDQVVEAGLDGLTMKALADRVDLSAAALYRYFPGKDAIVVALVAQVVAELDRAMEAAVRRSTSAGPLAAPLALIGAYRAWIAAHPRQSRLLALLVGSPELQVSSDAARPAVPGALALVGRLSAALAAAADGGALHAGDPLGRAVVVWATVDGVLARRKLLAHAPGLVDVDALADQSVLALLRGWGADPLVLRATAAAVQRELDGTARAEEGA